MFVLVCDLCGVLCVCASVHVCSHASYFLGRTKEDIRSSGNGITGGCELPSMVLGTKLCPTAMTENTPNTICKM